MAAKMRTKKSKPVRKKAKKPAAVKKVATPKVRYEDVTQSLSNKVKFQEEITSIRKEGLTMLEAIQEYCTRHGLEPESIPRMLTPIMLDHLYSEAQEFNLIKKVNTVDI